MVTKEEVCELNKHILAVSGTSADIYGTPNIGNLEYALGLANNEQNPVDQASILTHEIIRGQPFTNGNKRTGLETGIAILISGGHNFNAPEDEVIQFTKAVQEENKTREEVKEFFGRHSEFTGENIDFTTISGANVIRYREMLKKLD